MHQALGLEVVVLLGGLRLSLLLELLLLLLCLLGMLEMHLVLRLRLARLVDCLDHRGVNVEGVCFGAKLLGFEDLRVDLFLVLLVEVVWVLASGMGVFGEEELHDLLVHQRVGLLVVWRIEVAEAGGKGAILGHLGAWMFLDVLRRREDLGGGTNASSP